MAFDVPEGRFELVKIALAHLAILGLFTVAARWWEYFALWLLPALSLRMGLDELRQFLEHRNGRLVVYPRASSLERFFLGPFNFHLHAYHHVIASEPWFRLASAAERARQKEPTILELGTYAGEIAAYLRGEDSTAPPRSDDEATPAEAKATHDEERATA